MTLITILGFILIVIGIWGMLSQSNIIKIIIGFSIVDTGIHLVMVSIGYLKDRTAPILDETVGKAEALARVVDPVPSALVLTAIVIGLAVTALMLAYAVKLHEMKGSLDIHDLKELKW
ncbi:MAG: NADH-quinone oxidoreductase subunit K [Candidatus Marinimicrobia bacterium]|nr:NADH-quinone oxidoreductase subunit K [Candidatus Neomarinimicrobiota bacterium]